MDNQVQIFIQSFDGKTIVNFVDKTFKVKDLITKLKYDPLKTYFTYNGKMLNNNKNLLDQGVDNNDIIFLNSRIKGGIFPILIAALIAISGFMIALMILLEDLIIIFIKLIEIIPLIFDPKRFVDDLIFGVSYGLSSVMSGMFSSVNAGTSNSKRFDEDTSKISKVCVSPTLFNLVLLLICPPLALFMDRGIQGMFLVIVCAILTVKLYYFPGLIFAALHILC